MRYAIYRRLRSVFSQRFLSRLGGARQLNSLKRWLMGSESMPTLMEGEITWEDLGFFFAAPMEIYLGAQSGGIENRICRLARRTLLDASSPVTAIDVGANYGFISMVMGKSMDRMSRLISIEVDTNIAVVLEKTIAQNNLSCLSTIVPKKAGSKMEDDQITLEGLLIGQPFPPVRFIKIDVDGGDYHVLVGTENLLRICTPIVVIEMTAYQQEIYDMLKTLGYRYFIGQDNKPVVAGIWPANLIASMEQVFIPARSSFGKAI